MISLLRNTLRSNGFSFTDEAEGITLYPREDAQKNSNDRRGIYHLNAKYKQTTTPKIIL